MNQPIKSNEALENVRERLFKACNLLEILKGIDANEDTFNMGHEDIIKIIDDNLQGTFDPINDIFKALDVDIDLSRDEEARNNTIASIHAIKRREARGDDLEPQDYKSLFMERGDKLESCIRTLEEIKAIADLLTMSTGDGIPDFYDNTLENIGCLIINRVKAAMDEINTEPVVSQEEHGDR